MRGVTVQDGDGKPDRWCPLVYEYLPDFCYICGIIGHTEKSCSVQPEIEVVRQFDKSLRIIPSRGRFDGEMQRRPEQGRSGGRRPNLYLAQGRSEGSRGRWRNDGSRSDALSWKKSSDESGRVSVWGGAWGG